MPKVTSKSGKTKAFPYTAAGKKKAKGFAKRTGGKMTEKKPMGGY